MPRSSNPFHSLASAFPFLSSSSSPSTPASPAAPHLAVPLLLPVSSASTSSPLASSDSRRAPEPLPASQMAGTGASTSSVGKGGRGGGGLGPAFVGQVFTMLDPSGNGLMAVTTRFDLSHFLSTRAPPWFKSILSPLNLKKSEHGPVFRFFMDLNDAVSYVKRLNVPSGMVGACRLDVAYEHFKEKPHMFQFVPNEKQVKAADKLLKSIPQKGRRKRLGGVPVFSSQNLNMAVATNDGIRWYTPYFFDKTLLDNILETSVDQHFNSIMQNRHTQRRRDIFDDSLTSEIIEESADSLLEPPEVQELMNEIGPAGIPFNVVTKAAEIQFLDVVDKFLLGNKWLRKAAGIQPQFPYIVDSFEERTAVSIANIASTSSSFTASESDNRRQNNQQSPSLDEIVDRSESGNQNNPDNNQFHLPFGNLLPNIWHRDRKLKGQERDNKVSRCNADVNNDLKGNPLLPKITMVGISSEGAQMSKASLKKTMDDLTKELEQTGEKATFSEEKDPLFVANVGDYSRITKISSA